MTDSYLWDPRARPADPFVQRMERALAAKRYVPPQRWSLWKRVRVVAMATVAAGAAAAILVTAYGGGTPTGGTDAATTKGAGEIASERTTDPATPASDGASRLVQDEANVGH